MHTSSLQHGGSFFSVLDRWWRNWRESRARVAQLSAFTSRELDDVARDAGVTTDELRALAGKWPDSADLLNRRMAVLGLDPAEVNRGQPATSNDLRRLCSLCGSKRRCERDLAKHPADPVWTEYCPNATTLTALCDEQPRPKGSQ
jgi:hypothetical protein